MIDKSLNYGRENFRHFLQKIGPYQNVLDMGAGKGSDLMIAKSIRPEAALYGVEGYKPYADALRNLGVTVAEVDIEVAQLPFSPEQIDVIMINQVMEHLKDIWWVMDQMATVLKTGGHLLIGIPNLASLHNRVLLTLGKQPTSIQNNSAHVRGYTLGDMLAFVNAGHPAGFELVGYKGANFYPFPPAVAKPLAAIFPTMSWGLTICLKKTKPYQGGFLKYPIEKQLETNFYLGPSK